MLRKTVRSLLLASAVGVFGLVSQNALAAESAAPGPIIVGSANFAEAELMATIYATGLQRAGLKVEKKLNIGSREVYIKALEEGGIDLVPEYNGTLLSYFNPKATAKSHEEVQSELAKILKPHGLVALKASVAQDTDELVVKAGFAKKHKLTSIADLRPIAGDLTLAAPPEWKTRYQGIPGLKAVYGVSFGHVLTLDAGGPLTLTALLHNHAQVGDMFSSDPAVPDNGLVPLKDTKNLFTEARIVPIIKEKFATPKVRKVLDDISAALTQKGLIELNAKINKGVDFQKIADAWLDAHHLP